MQDRELEHHRLPLLSRLGMGRLLSCLATPRPRCVMGANFHEVGSHYDRNTVRPRGYVFCTFPRCRRYINGSHGFELSCRQEAHNRSGLKRFESEGFGKQVFGKICLMLLLIATPGRYQQVSSPAAAAARLDDIYSIYSVLMMTDLPSAIRGINESTLMIAGCGCRG